MSPPPLTFSTEPLWIDCVTFVRTHFDFVGISFWTLGPKKRSLKWWIYNIYNSTYTWQCGNIRRSLLVQVWLKERPSILHSPAIAFVLFAWLWSSVGGTTFWNSGYMVVYSATAAKKFLAKGKYARMDDANRALCYAMRHPGPGQKPRPYKDIRKVVRKTNGKKTIHWCNLRCCQWFHGEEIEER